MVHMQSVQQSVAQGTGRVPGTGLDENASIDEAKRNYFQCGFVRDLLAGGELSYLQDFEAKRLAQLLPGEDRDEPDSVADLQGVPALDLQSDLDDGAEGLRHATEQGVPVMLSKGKDTSRVKLHGRLQERFPKRITFAYGEKGWNSTIDNANAKNKRDWSPRGDRNPQGDRDPQDYTYFTVFAEDEEHAVTLEDDFWQMLERANVMELYSPPRLAAWAEKLGLRSGGSLDLSTGWDFDKQEDVNQPNQEMASG